MEKFDTTLEHYIQKLTKQKRKLEPSECLEIIIQLMSIFEIVHKSKRTYNDLKLANIMINYDAKTNKFRVVLIDYGFSNFYVEDNGKHI
jgi:serine/threonine protein kinase